jgi:hypothetical protein
MKVQVVFVVAMIVLMTAVDLVSGYTGGPVTAEILGYDSVDKKVFFRLVDHDESGTPPMVFYFDLQHGRPRTAVRALSLETTFGEYSAGRYSPAYGALQKRLVRLKGVDRVRCVVDCEAESLGREQTFDVPRYRLKVALEANGTAAHMSLDAYCDPRVGMGGIYGIPGHEELLVVVTYTGRRYGCERVDLPVILTRAEGSQIPSSGHQ